MLRFVRPASVLLAVFVGLGSLVGCASGSSSSNTQDVVSKLVTGTGNVANFTSDITATLGLETVGGSSPAKLNMVLDGTAESDVTHDKSHTELNVTTDLTGQDQQKMDINLYAADQWQYLSIPMGEGAPQWVKIARAGEVLVRTSQIAQEAELLKNATNATMLASETVNGVSCYVIQAKPDTQKLLALMLGQAQTHYTLGLQDSDFSTFDYTKVVKSVSLKAWIARDTYRLMKTVGAVTMELSPEDVGSTSDFDKLTMSMEMTFAFSKYNGTAEIVVPADALAAPEMGPASTESPPTAPAPEPTPVSSATPAPTTTTP